jgi:hypothetical protein
MQIDCIFLILFFLLAKYVRNYSTLETVYNALRLVEMKPCYVTILCRL